MLATKGLNCIPPRDTMITKNTNRKQELKKNKSRKWPTNLHSKPKTPPPFPFREPIPARPCGGHCRHGTLWTNDAKQLQQCSAVSRSRTNSARFGAFARRRSCRKSGEGRERTDPRLVPPPRAYTLSINPRSAVTCCLAISQERRNSHSPNPSNRCRDFVPTIAYYFRK